MKFLVIDDKAFSREITARYLRLVVAHAGVIEAANAKGVVDLIQSERPDIVFVDLHMPDIDGFECTREIRQVAGHIPIVAITANAMSEARKRILAAGANSYITKPIDFEELKKVVGKWIDHDQLNPF